MADPVVINPSNDVLDSFIADARTVASQRAASSSSVAPDRLQSMMTVFQEAFPDQDFSIADGAVIGKQKPRVPQAAAPAGFSPKAASVGIEEMTAALTAATDDEERYKIATRLNALVQTQKMYKFEEYRAQSEALYGVPDLLQTIDALKKAEATSPFNPGGGQMSMQRFSVMQALGTARTSAATRIKELMTNDPVYAAAENLSQGVIAEVLGGLKVGEKSDRLEKKRLEEAVRTDAIDTMTPEQTDAVSIVLTGKAPTSPEQRRALAGKMVDGKIKLNPIQTHLAGATPEGLISFYSSNPKEADKGTAIALLLAKETEAVGGDAQQAEINVKGFKVAMEKNLGAVNDGTIPPEFKNRWQETMKLAAGTTGKEAQLEVHNARVKIRMDYLAYLGKLDVYSNVRPWKGLMQSDPTALKILKEHDFTTKPLSVNLFIDKYLQTDDKADLSSKSASLQAIITSAFQALPQSILIPPPSPDSARTKALELVALRMMRTQMERNPMYVRSGASSFGNFQTGQE